MSLQDCLCFVTPLPEGVICLTDEKLKGISAPDRPIPEITGEMLAAGMDAFADWELDKCRSEHPVPEQRVAYMVTAIFEAMTRD